MLFLFRCLHLSLGLWIATIRWACSCAVALFWPHWLSLFRSRPLCAQTHMLLSLIVGLGSMYRMVVRMVSWPLPFGDLKQSSPLHPSSSFLLPCRSVLLYCPRSDLLLHSSSLSVPTSHSYCRFARPLLIPLPLPLRAGYTGGGQRARRVAARRPATALCRGQSGPFKGLRQLKLLYESSE